MTEYAIQYENPKESDFWCEVSNDWHPKCECKKQCFECALIQSNKRKPKTK